MPVTLLRTWGGKLYPWGYLLRIDLTDGEQTICTTAQWPTAEPTPSEVDMAVAVAIARAEAERAPVPAPEPTYLVVCEDGTEVLI